MKFITLLSLALLCELTSAQPLPDRDLAEYIEARIDSGEYVGMIVGYFDDSGSYTQSFGRAHKKSEVAPDEHTIFEISSVSKTFVATLLGKAVVAGKMSLDDPVNRYLGDDAKLAGTEGRDVLLVDLAAHQSGLPNLPENLNPGDGTNRLAQFNIDDLLASINGYRPEIAAGTGYGYSAFGYAVLALALSRTYDATFEELVRRELTAPLGMTDTVAALSPAQKKRLATGYTPEGEIAIPLDQGAFRAAGSMYSTLSDLMVWVRTHTGGTDSTLAKAARLTHKLQNDSATVGLAWHRKEGYDDRSQYGTANGYRAFAGFLADGSKGAVVLANTKANVQDIGERLLLGVSLPE